MKTNTNQPTKVNQNQTPQVKEYDMLWQKRKKDSKKELERKIKETQHVKLGAKISEQFFADWQIDVK